MINFKRLTRLNTTTAAALIGFGLILGGASLIYTWRAQQSAASAQSIKNSQVTDDGTPVLKGTPVRIAIPSVGINLKVIPGYYYPATKSWSLSLDDAQYGVMTAPANNKQGLTFIYAHYRPGVFLSLPKIQPGAQALITTDNGHVFSYTFRRSTVTTPNDTSLFSYQGKPLMVLQTCTGVWYQNRQLFMFDLAKAV